jgi:hypothetical protein
MKTEESSENTGVNNTEATETCEQKQTQPVEFSEKAGKAMRKSVGYLNVYFWTVICFSVLVLLRFMLATGQFNESGLSAGTTRLFTFFALALLGVTIVKVYAYLRDYKNFIASKSKRTLEDMLDAQRRFYGWVFVMPLIVFGVVFGIALVLFILGDVLSRQ